MLQVSHQDAKKFAQVWTNKGVAIFMQDVHIQFAADFANIVLKSFIENAQKAAAAKAAEAAAPKVTLVQ